MTDFRILPPGSLKLVDREPACVATHALAGAVTHTGPIDIVLAATLQRGLYCRCRFNLVLLRRQGRDANQNFSRRTSIHEAAHADVHHDPERQERKHH